MHLTAFHLSFDIFEVLLPDLLHEMELGVWKHLFIHLLRLLDCVDDSLKVEVARRYVVRLSSRADIETESAIEPSQVSDLQLGKSLVIEQS